MNPSSPVLLMNANSNNTNFDVESVESFVDDLTAVYKKTVESVEEN